MPQHKLKSKVLAQYGQNMEEAVILDIWFDVKRDDFDFFIHYENFHARYDRWLDISLIKPYTTENQMAMFGVTSEGRSRQKPSLSSSLAANQSDRKRKRASELQQTVLNVEDELNDLTVMPDPSLVPVTAGSVRTFSNGLVHDLTTMQLRFPAQLRRILVVDYSQMLQNQVG